MPRRAPEGGAAAARGAASDDAPTTPVAGAPGEAPREGESSIITSAPVLGAEPPRVPRASAGKGAGVNAAEPPARARPMPSLSGETGLLAGAGARAKRDRTKSPGFYSNLAPAHAADKVSPGHAALKRTVLGVAPPPELIDGAAAAGRATPPQTGAAGEAADASADASAPSPGAAGAEPPMPGSRPRVAAADAPGTERRLSAARLAAPASGADPEEKEDTSPGLGHARSRHDPSVRLELPQGDLDLLVDFVMDLGLGAASEAWLAPAREAVARLRAAAARAQRNRLEKALGQLVVELDAPNALAEERRGRISQALILVDLALPRPIDVPGQRLVRERLIVQHLVAELATAHPRVARWLRDENVVSLERLVRLGADELAERAELGRDHAVQALAVFSQYLAERARRGPELALLGKTRALTERLAELEAAAEQFERVADADDRLAKREARRRRQAAVERLSLLLAERGEAALLAELERCSVQGKIERLRRWLTEPPAGSVRAPAVEPPQTETTG